jgi:superfamily II DNA or RNA helicase
MSTTVQALPRSEFLLRVYAELLGQRRSSLDEAQIVDALGSSLVDLNPHQIEAALKAYQGALQTGRGILLADEVGLGKTVEALLIVAQFWAKHQRRILLLVPASLRAQWKEEIENKFALPAEIADTKRLRELSADTLDRVLITTPQSAYNNLKSIERVSWDLVVVDEAHRLRNVYMGRKVASALQEAFENVPKLLLSATPLQNKIEELFGLMMFIDPHLFGDLDTFLFQYGEGENHQELRRRIEPYIARTLRRQVREYIRFTDRHCLIQNFRSGPLERELHEEVRAFLQRSRIPAFNLAENAAGFGYFILLIYWRLLASSTAAIAGALSRLEARLRTALERGDWSMLSAANGELSEIDTELEAEAEEGGARAEPKFSVAEVEADLEWVERMARLARRAEAEEPGKADRLIVALRELFAEAPEKGYPQKAVIFTEFIRTQEHLVERLEQAGFAGQITVFNGRVGDAARRRELIEEFRTKTQIFISTEAGAEGLNLQFCNVVINYDLPWNPQRIEQRIGRCHRYGQDHDVVVCNFVNLENEAEARLHELLQHKLHLFDGLFGASDEILGALGSGIDFERRILAILQQCRSPEEIQEEFDRLQDEFQDSIQETMEQARSDILDTFDDDVVRRLKSLEDLTKSVHEGEAALSELLHHALPAGALQTDQLEDHPELTVYRLGVQDDLTPLATGHRLVTLDRAPRDVAPMVERINLAHPLVQHIIERKRAEGPVWERVELQRPTTPRAALLDDLYASGGHSGAWYLFRTTSKGFETVDDLCHVVTVEGREEPLVGEAAGRFLRAMIIDAMSAEVIKRPSEVSLQEVGRARDEFESRLREIYGDLYFRRREELNLRIFDEEQVFDDHVAELRRQLAECNRRMSAAGDSDTKEQLLDEADSIEKRLRRARRRQNEFLDELEDQKDRELRKLDAYRNIEVSTPLLVAGSQWAIVG